jgi:hypothetical protein
MVVAATLPLAAAAQTVQVSNADNVTDSKPSSNGVNLVVGGSTSLPNPLLSSKLPHVHPALPHSTPTRLLCSRPLPHSSSCCTLLASYNSLPLSRLGLGCSELRCCGFACSTNIVHSHSDKYCCTQQHSSYASASYHMHEFVTAVDGGLRTTGRVQLM